MTSFNPKVSVIIPVYNGANYMREAIDSAISQTYANKEIIVINDGSNDNGATLSIARSYGDKIKLIDKPNGGVATALNTGIVNASGDYISWLSHDDIYPPEKIENQITALKTLPEKETILFGDFKIINEKGEPMGVVSTAHVDTNRMTFELYASQCIHGCSMLVPKSTFAKAGMFREDLPTTQDYDLWLRASKHVKFAHFPGVVVFSRQHAEQGSRQAHHNREVLDYYLNNFDLLNPAWLDSHYSQEEIREKYLLLLRTFSRGNLWAAYFRVIKQALGHLHFKNIWGRLQFLLKALFILNYGSLKGMVKNMIPLRLKNLLRRNLNRPTNENDNKPAVLDFTKIYKKNIFGSSESRSGSGSTMEQTAYIREVFPTLFKEFDIKSILDVPCGDFNWMRHVDLAGIQYIGGDIVPDLISQNNEKYKNAETEFRNLNIITDELPRVDVILCRDCLVHLNFESGMKAIQNFKKSGSTYLLTTTFTDRDANEDLFGIWRTLNLQKAPYNLPMPVRMINEKCTEGNKKFTDKSLGLWKLADI